MNHNASAVNEEALGRLHIFLSLIKLTNFWLGGLGVCCCMQVLPLAASRGYSRQGLLLPYTRWHSTDCAAQAQQLWLTRSGARGRWNLPGPGTEPMSPALAHGFLTTGQSGKSHISFYRASIDFIIMLLAYTEKC